ncbi:hypothetical protein DFR44_1381, partial [Hydromonas duriensis]
MSSPKQPAKPAARKPKKFTPIHQWTPEQIALLGQKTDTEVASLLGLSKAQVQHKRSLLGIPPLHQRNKVNWTPAQLAALGTMSDVALSKQIGISIDNIAYMRQKLGIPVAQNYRDKQVQLIIERVQRICADKGGLLLDGPENYTGYGGKLLVRCDKGHQFRATSQNLFSGSWCLTCARMKRRLYSLVDLQEFAQKRGGRCLSQHYSAAENNPPEWECHRGHRWREQFNYVQRLV